VFVVGLGQVLHGQAIFGLAAQAGLQRRLLLGAAALAGLARRVAWRPDGFGGPAG